MSDYSLHIHPLPGGFGWSRGHDPGTYRLWRGEEIVARVEIAPRPQVSLGASLNFDPAEDETALGLHSPLGSLYAALKGSPVKDWRRGERELSLRLYSNTDGHMPDLILSAYLWGNPNEWHHDDPWWKRIYVPLISRGVGQPERSEREIARRVVPIPLPEGACEADVVLKEITYRYPRWPWPRTFRAAEVTPRKPPVIPGKGENSWDLDDDAISSLYTQAHTIEDAVGRFVASVLSDRQRRAGSWTYPEREARQAAE